MRRGFMELVTLSKKEFDAVALKGEITNFQQSSNWGRFMDGDIFHAYYVGGKVKGKIVAVTLLLAKEIKFFKERIFYAPRGFIIDYKNKELLNEFTNQIKKFVKEKKGIMLKIDPYVPLNIRDENKMIIKGDISNQYIIDNLLECGYIEANKNIQPKFISRINLKENTLDDVFNNFSSKARQIIRRNEKLGFKVKELDFKEITKLIDLINQKEGSKYKVKPTIDFYRDLHQAFGDNLKLMGCYFNKKMVTNNISKMIDEIQKRKEDRIGNYQNSKMTADYFIAKEEDYDKDILRLNSLLDYFNNCNDEEILMSIGLYIIVGNEVLLKDSGSYFEYKKFDASYTLNYEMIKYASINGYTYYNLYNVGNILSANNNLEKAYLYKKNFEKNVTQLIGEFDLVIDKNKHFLAKLCFPQYLGINSY